MDSPSTATFESPVWGSPRRGAPAQVSIRGAAPSSPHEPRRGLAGKRPRRGNGLATAAVVRRLAAALCVAAAVARCSAGWGQTHGQITAAARTTYVSNATAFPSDYYLDYYLNGTPPYPAYDGGLLAWGETYLGMGQLAMFRSTGDERYLRGLLDRAEVMYANRADRLSPPLRDEIRNRVMPAFVSFNISEGADARRHSWMMESAYVSHPVTLAIAAIKKDGRLEGLYGARADAILADVIATMDSFDGEYSVMSGGRGKYVDPYLAFTDPYTLGALPYNMQSAIGQNYIALWRATGEQRFHDRATALAKTLKAEMSAVGNRYQWRYAPYNAAGSASDISHAGLDVGFAVDAYEAGIVFNDADVQRLANALRYARKGPGFTDAVNGSGEGKVANVRLASTWLPLVRHDAALRTEMFPAFQSYWGTDCCTWPMLGAAFFHESGNYYRHEATFADSFDDLQLDPRWRRAAAQPITDVWEARTDGSRLVVSDIATASVNVWTEIVRTREIAQDATWELACEFSWDSAEGTADPLRAMQRFFVDLRDPGGGLLASIGVNDAWNSQHGARFVHLLGQSLEEPAGTLPAAGTARLRVRSDGAAGLSQIFWNDALVLSAPSAASLGQASLRVGSYRRLNGLRLESHFGTFAIDALAVSEPSEIPADFNQDGRVDAHDLALWEFAYGPDAGSAYLLAWQRQFGAGAAGGPTTAAVPEPSASGLGCLIGLVAAGLRGPRRQRTPNGSGRSGRPRPASRQGSGWGASQAA